MAVLPTGMSMAYLWKMTPFDARANLTRRAHAGLFLCRREVAIGNALKFVCLSNVVPWHDFPAPAYPFLQVKKWEPLVLVQFASSSQA